MNLTNNPELIFKDISKEKYREYYFCNETGGLTVIRIEKPVALSVSASGGHRVIDVMGVAWYIPYKWILLKWDNLEDTPRINF